MPSANRVIDTIEELISSFATNRYAKWNGTAFVGSQVDYSELTSVPAAFTPSAHNVLDSTYHTDTLTGAVARGSLIVGNSTPKWSALAVGAANKILQSDGTDAAWSAGTITFGGASSALTLPNAATTITGGGTLALGGFTLSVPATGTAALLATQNSFSVPQFIVPGSTNVALTVQQTASGNEYQVMLRGQTYDATIGDFNFLVDGTPYFNSTRDYTLFFGYNVSTQGARQVLTEPTLHWGLESNYEVTPGTYWMENYMQYVSSDGLTTYRPFSFIIDRATHATQAGFIFQSATFNTPTTTAPNIGWGTTNPLYPAHIVGNINNSFNGVVINNTNTGTAAISAFTVGESIGGTNRYMSLLVTSSGYTGLASTAWFYADSGLTGGIKFTAVANAPIVLATNNATRLTISGAGVISATSTVYTTGSVGVGASPSYKFDVQSGATGYIANFAGAAGRFFIFNTNVSGDYEIGTGTSANLLFDINLATKMRLNTAANLLIGTATDGMTANGSLAIAQDLAHRGTKVGFMNTAPATIPAAYTQTYATATRTHANPTAAALTDNSGGLASGTLAAITGGGANCEDATKNAVASLAAQIAALITDHANTKQVMNQILDDIQAYGLLQ